MPRHQVILNQSDVIALIAEHYKVDPAKVHAAVSKGFDGGQRDYEAPSFTITVDLPAVSSATV